MLSTLKPLPPVRLVRRWLREARGRYTRRRAARGHKEFRRQFEAFGALAAQSQPRLSLRWEDRYPCLDDASTTTSFDRHYVYHTAWAARVVARLRPAVHVDIGSSIYFSALVSAFVPVRCFDYRPAKITLSDLNPGRADLLALPFSDASVESLSCMHTVEHVGLGRYGDPLDPDGDLKAMAELRRVLSPGGSLLFVVPVGRPRIEFNAHRIYAYRQIRDAFADLTLVQFALIPDDAMDGGLVIDATAALSDRQIYGCGCFWFQRADQ